MRSLFSLVLGITMAVVLFVGGVAAASWILAEPAPHRFAHLDERPLWTNRPVAIDPQAQSFERIAAAPVPPVYLAMAIEVADERKPLVAMAADEGAVQNASLDMEATGAIDDGAMTTLAGTPHAEWCQSRYNSYRIDDNTYQPYNGPRRSCESPHMAENTAPDTARAETIAYSAASERPLVHTGNAHMTWCLERYRSYRAEDNSYQPYNGPRRVCESPFG
jgi:hypothetical protein